MPPTLESRRPRVPHLAELPFYSIYRHGFVRVAVATPSVEIASPTANVAEMSRIAREATANQAILVVFPELGISAYSNEDLFQQDALLDGSVQALGTLVEASKEIGITLAVGMPLRVDDRLFNCAVLLRRGELLGAVPTVVYGYFALLMVTPFLQKFMPNLPGFNMLSAGLVIGLMIVPYVASVSEDAMRAVPRYMREGSYAMGATKLQTALRVVVPGALSGIAAAYILGISRAIGETMVVAIAAGMQPTLTFNPTEPAATITAYIVQVSLGDLPHDSIGYQSIFAAGLVLMLMTLVFNVIGFFLTRKFREAY